MPTLWALLIIALAFWFWSDSLRARERVLRACRLACQQLEVQLLDQTVALSKLRLGRNSQGRWHLRRLYAFEFSTDGVQRYQGRAALHGKVMQYVHLDHPDGSTFLQLKPARKTDSTSARAPGSSDMSRNEMGELIDSRNLSI